MLKNAFQLPRPFGSFLLVAATTLSPVHLQAQSSLGTNNDTPQPQQSSNRSANFKNFFHPQTSISLGTFGQFTPTRIQSTPQYGVYPINGVTPTNFSTSGASPSAGVLGTFRQQFRPWFGYSVNMGYTRVTERFTQYSNTSLTENDYDVKLNSNMYELSLSYVASKRLTRHMSGFAEAGAGVLAFLPVVPASRVSNYYEGLQNSLYFANTQFVPETVGGLGFHWHLANSFGLRAEYRGLIYKNTPFGYTLHKATTLSSEPTVSLTYSFGHK